MPKSGFYAQAVRTLIVVTLATAPASCAAGSSATAEFATTTGSKATMRYEVRGIYDRDLSPTGFDREAALGFTFIDSSVFDDFGELAARHLKGFVWLGGYSNDSCSFVEDDAWIRKHVSAIADSPGVGAYFIDDEPDAAACPQAPAQMKARSDLVKSIDRGRPTFLVMYKLDQLKLFAGTVDVIGLDTYPCTLERGCDFAKIDAQADLADRVGVRYWGVIQAFGDDWYKLPTRDELHREFTHWRATNMEGYLVFAWRHPDGIRSLWLANHPGLQAQLAEENAE